MHTAYCLIARVTAAHCLNDRQAAGKHGSASGQTGLHPSEPKLSRPAALSGGGAVTTRPRLGSAPRPGVPGSRNSLPEAWGGADAGLLGETAASDVTSLLTRIGRLWRLIRCCCAGVVGGRVAVDPSRSSAAVSRNIPLAGHPHLTRTCLYVLSDACVVNRFDGKLCDTREMGHFE